MEVSDSENILVINQRGWETIPTNRRTKDMTTEQNRASTGEASTRSTTREERLEVMIRVKREEEPMKALLKLKKSLSGQD